MAQWMKNLPAMQETQATQVQSLGQEDPLEKEMATYSSILAWEISMDRGAWQAWRHPWGGRESNLTQQLNNQ